jgi:hypothetical protein
LRASAGSCVIVILRGIIREGPETRAVPGRRTLQGRRAGERQTSATPAAVAVLPRATPLSPEREERATVILASALASSHPAFLELVYSGPQMNPLLRPVSSKYSITSVLKRFLNFAFIRITEIRLDKCESR